jgi:hypothetical protein
VSHRTLAALSRKEKRKSKLLLLRLREGNEMASPCWCACKLLFVPSFLHCISVFHFPLLFLFKQILTTPSFSLIHFIARAQKRADGSN